MRLIDANELKEWIENWVTVNKYYHPYSKSNNIPINEVYAILKQMPAIDTDPIRHGHWEKSKDDNDRWRCSHCGYTYIGFNGADTTFAEMCNYCPHCGAKIDEVEE